VGYTSKQIRDLKALAHHLKPVIQVGKAGIGGNLLEQVELALESHELIKVSVLETSPQSRDEVATLLAEETRATCVQTIGKLVVLYRRRKKNPQIQV
jgi:RNA-binding protein